PVSGSMRSWTARFRSKIWRWMSWPRAAPFTVSYTFGSLPEPRKGGPVYFDLRSGALGAGRVRRPTKRVRRAASGAGGMARIAVFRRGTPLAGVRRRRHRLPSLARGDPAHEASRIVFPGGGVRAPAGDGVGPERAAARSGAGRSRGRGGHAGGGDGGPGRLLRAHGGARTRARHRERTLLPHHSRPPGLLPVVGDADADLHRHRTRAPSVLDALRRHHRRHGHGRQRGGPGPALHLLLHHPHAAPPADDVVP